MVITKHYALHGKKYRKSLIKYILNPDKTNNLTLVSDFAISNYLDFPSYEEMVEMYHANFLSNDSLYESRHDRQEKHQQNICAHHVIQSFAPEDTLTPEEVHRIGMETAKELTNGQFQFVVATHVDQDHLHNHIIINAIDRQSTQKLKWDYKLERNLRQISDKIAKMAGAKIIDKNRYSHHDYMVYKNTNYKFQLKQRLYFAMEQAKDFDDFMEKAQALHVKIDFSRKHARFLMTDTPMQNYIRGDKLNRREPYTKEFFQEYFAKKAMNWRLDFLLQYVTDLEELMNVAKILNLTITPKIKHIDYTLEQPEQSITIPNQKLNLKALYDVAYFEAFFAKQESVLDQPENWQEAFDHYQEGHIKELVSLEDMATGYQDYQNKRDAVHEYELVFNPNRIAKLVKDGIFIKVGYGIGKEGLVFIENRQLDIREDGKEKGYHIFIRETASFFIYNQKNSEKNRFVKGRELIRQLSMEQVLVPQKRWVTLEMLQEKIAEINLLIELDIENRSYLEIKDELVKEIAEVELTINDLNQKIATLHKAAKVLLNLEHDEFDVRQLAMYDFSKMNLTSGVTRDTIEKELEIHQIQFNEKVNVYEENIRRLEQLVALVNRGGLIFRTDNLSKRHEIESL